MVAPCSLPQGIAILCWWSIHCGLIRLGSLPLVQLPARSMRQSRYTDHLLPIRCHQCWGSLLSSAGAGFYMDPPPCTGSKIDDRPDRITGAGEEYPPPGQRVSAGLATRDRRVFTRCIPMVAGMKITADMKMKWLIISSISGTNVQI